MSLAELKALFEREEVTRWATDYLARDHLDSRQYEGWRIHDMPNKPNPHGVWIANYVIGGIDDKDTAELICASVNLVRALVADGAVEIAAKAMCVAEGDDWLREGLGGLDSYRDLAQAALSALLGLGEKEDGRG